MNRRKASSIPKPMGATMPFSNSVVKHRCGRPKREEGLDPAHVVAMFGFTKGDTSRHRGHSFSLGDIARVSHVAFGPQDPRYGSRAKPSYRYRIRVSCSNEAVEVQRFRIEKADCAVPTVRFYHAGGFVAEVPGIEGLREFVRTIVTCPRCGTFTNAGKQCPRCGLDFGFCHEWVSALDRRISEAQGRDALCRWCRAFLPSHGTCAFCGRKRGEA